MNEIMPNKFHLSIIALQPLMMFIIPTLALVKMQSSMYMYSRTMMKNKTENHSETENH